MLRNMGLADSGGTAFPRASQFLERRKDLLMSIPFICKPTNSEPTLSEFTELLHSYTLDHYSPSLITLGPGTGQLRTVLTRPSPL